MLEKNFFFIYNVDNPKTKRKVKTMKNIGDIISSNRKKKKLSQPMLAELLREEGFQLSAKAVSKWERNATEPGAATFLAICKVLGITDIYEAYYGDNPDDPLSSLNEEGKAKALDYIALLHDAGKYEGQAATLVSFFRSIDIYENAVSAGTGNFLVDGPKETLSVAASAIPESADYGVRISGDSMEPEYKSGQIAWVRKQDSLDHGEIGIFCLNGEAYIKKLQEHADSICLVSLNEAYPPIPVAEHDQLDILGKVVGHSYLEDLEHPK